MEPRNFKSGASASPPTAPVTPSNGYPTEGNPAGGTPATLPGAFWFHKVGEELRAVITGFGLTPSDTALNQVYTGILGQFDSSLAVNGWHKTPDKNLPGGYRLRVFGQTANYNSESGQVLTLAASIPNKVLSAGATILTAAATGSSDQGAQIYGITPGSPASTIGIYLAAYGGIVTWPASALYWVEGY